VADAPVVAIVGMRALRRDLNRLTDDVKSPLYAAMKDAGRRAAEPVAARARSSIPKDDRPESRWNHPGRLASTIRTSGTRTGAAVRMGRATARYAGWVEFGGHRPDGSSRPFVADGRYLFPAARGLANESATLYTQEMQRVFDDARTWSNSTTNPEAVHE
jgi:hypothetical protein